MASDHISDLTIEEFRQLVRETVREALEEATQSAKLAPDGEWAVGVSAIMEAFDDVWGRLADL